MDTTRAYAPLTPPRAARNAARAAGSGLRSAKLCLRRARARGVRCGASLPRVAVGVRTQD